MSAEGSLISICAIMDSCWGELKSISEAETSGILEVSFTGGDWTPAVEVSIVAGELEPRASWSRAPVAEEEADALALGGAGDGAAATSGEGAEPEVEAKPEEGI